MTVHAPVPSAIAVPTCVVPSKTFTVLFATAVPVRVGVLSLVMWSPATPLSVENLAIVGAAGAVGGGAVGPPGVLIATPAKVAGRLEALSAWPSRSLIVPLTDVTASAEVSDHSPPCS